MESRYYVTNNGDRPESIYFHSMDAFRSGAKYIDVFSEGGVFMHSYVWDSDGQVYI